MDKNKVYDLLKISIEKDNVEDLNYEEIISKIKNIVQTIIDVDKEVASYMSERLLYFDSDKARSYLRKRKPYSDRINDIREKINKSINKKTSINIYNEVIKMYNELNILHKKFLDTEDPNKKPSQSEIDHHEYFRKLSHEDKIKELNRQQQEFVETLNQLSNSLNGFSDTVEQVVENTKEKLYCEECGTEVSDDCKFCPECGCGFADADYNSHTNNNDIVYDNLETWQKKEVDEGNYDPYNFEEDEYEDDDYYGEDDD